MLKRVVRINKRLAQGSLKLPADEFRTTYVYAARFTRGNIASRVNLIWKNKPNLARRRFYVVVDPVFIMLPNIAGESDFGRTGKIQGLDKNTCFDISDLLIRRIFPNLIKVLVSILFVSKLAGYDPNRVHINP